MGANRHLYGMRDRLACHHVESAIVLRALDLVTVHESLGKVRLAVGAESIDRKIGVLLRAHDRQLAAIDSSLDDVTTLNLIGTRDVVPAIFRHATVRGIITD